MTFPEMICAHHNILYCETFFSQSCCQEFINSFRENEAKRRTFEGILNQKFRDVFFAVLFQKFNEYFYNFLHTKMQPFYNTIFDEFINSPMMFSYPVGQGFKPHSDRYTPETISVAKRNHQPVIAGDYTILIFLNGPGDYDGGEFIFPEYNITLKPETGSVVAFPATDQYIHCVNPISRGNRLTVINRSFLENANLSLYAGTHYSPHLVSP